MTSRWRWTACALTACGLFGCVDQGTLAPVPALDGARYADEVQPFVAASCATLDCHGDPGRPLRLYSELGLRERDSLRIAPIDDETEPSALTSDELADNIASFAAIEPGVGPGDERLALSKPLAEAAGGGHHGGGNLFGTRDAPGYLCLRRWLTGSNGDANSCAEAQAALPDPWP